RVRADLLERHRNPVGGGGDGVRAPHTPQHDPFRTDPLTSPPQVRPRQRCADMVAGPARPTVTMSARAPSGCPGSAVVQLAEHGFHGDTWFDVPAQRTAAA